MGLHQFYNISWVFLYFCVSGYLEKMGALKVNQRGKAQEEKYLVQEGKIYLNKDCFVVAVIIVSIILNDMVDPDMNLIFSL